MNRKTATLAMGAVAILAALSAATAYGTTYGTITAEFTGVAGGNTVTIKRPDGLSYLTCMAGLYLFEKISVDPATYPLNPAVLLDDEFGGYCIDVRQTISKGKTFTWTVQDLQDAPIVNGTSYAMGTGKATLLKRLWYNWYDTGPRDEFQVAVWEIVSENPANGYGVKDEDGDFWVKSDPDLNRDLINGWLDSITGAAYDSTHEANLLYAMTNGCTQDFAFIIEGGDKIIPEPTTLAGLVLGAAGLVRYIRRRKAGSA